MTSDATLKLTVQNALSLSWGIYFEFLGTILACIKTGIFFKKDLEEMQNNFLVCVPEKQKNISEKDSYKKDLK